MSMWTVIFVIGCATFLLRSVFIIGGGRATSGWFENLRRFVPVAALTALIVPALVRETENRSPLAP